MIQGIITAILLIAFIGGWIWLYGASRRPAIEAAARMPLDDEPSGSAIVSHTESEDRP